MIDDEEETKDAHFEEASAVPCCKASEAVSSIREEHPQDNDTPTPHCCEGCQSPNAVNRCGGCGSVFYCGKSCQKGNWPVHKLRCKKLKAAAAAAVVAAQEPLCDIATDNRGNCWTCGADNPTKMCRGCSVAKYCDAACQGENWPIHASRCKSLAGQASKFDKAIERMKALARGGTMHSQGVLDADLVIACTLGRLADMQRLIAAGGGVNTATPKTASTPIIAAALDGHLRVIEALVRLGAGVNAADKHGGTATFYSAQEGQHKVVQALLTAGGSANCIDDAGYAPIHIASYHGHLKVVHVLLEHEEGLVNSVKEDGARPLHFASYRGHPIVVEFLIDRGALVNATDNNGGTALLLSAEKGHLKVVQVLLEHGALPDVVTLHRKSSPLNMSCQLGSLDIVTLLLEKNAQTNLADSNGTTPLTKAAYNGHAAIVRLLLEHGGNVHPPTGASPLNVACHMNHIQVVKDLLNSGASADEPSANGEDNGPIHTAVRAGNGDVVRLLLQAGADPSRLGVLGRSPLLWAAHLGFIDILAMLLEKGNQHLETPDVMGVRPLHVAALDGYLEACRLLLRAGASPFKKTNLGTQPINPAIINNHPDVVALLLESGFRVDEPFGKVGSDLLSLAACLNHLDVVRVLLSSRAEPRYRQDNGWDALDYARSHGNEEMVALLEARIAELEAEEQEQEEEEQEQEEPSPPRTPSPDL